LQEIHHEVFNFFRSSLSGLYTNEKTKAPFKKHSIDENENGKILTKEEYEALSNEEAF